MRAAIDIAGDECVSMGRGGKVIGVAVQMEPHSGPHGRVGGKVAIERRLVLAIDDQITSSSILETAWVQE
jgi:hypothetical protein